MSVRLKSFCKKLCPPIIWNAISRLLHRVLGKPHSRPFAVDICGANTVINGVVDKRSAESQIVIGNDCLIEGTLVTEKQGSSIFVGNNVFVGGGTILDCTESIVVEDDVLISFGSLLSDSDHHSLRYSIRRKDLAGWKRGRLMDWTTSKSSPIHICKGAWIGPHVIIIKGVTIGEGAVIGAGAVVTRNIPPWTLAAGNPARVIREFPENER